MAIDVSNGDPAAEDLDVTSLRGGSLGGRNCISAELELPGQQKESSPNEDARDRMEEAKERLKIRSNRSRAVREKGMAPHPRANKLVTYMLHARRDRGICERCQALAQMLKQVQEADAAVLKHDEELQALKFSFEGPDQGDGSASMEDDAAECFRLIAALEKDGDTSSISKAPQLSVVLHCVNFVPTAGEAGQGPGNGESPANGPSSRAL